MGWSALIKVWISTKRRIFSLNFASVNILMVSAIFRKRSVAVLNCSLSVTGFLAFSFLCTLVGDVTLARISKSSQQELTGKNYEYLLFALKTIMNYSIPLDICFSNDQNMIREEPPSYPLYENRLNVGKAAGKTWRNHRSSPLSPFVTCSSCCCLKKSGMLMIPLINTNIITLHHMLSLLQLRIPDDI